MAERRRVNRTGILNQKMWLTVGEYKDRLSLLEDIRKKGIRITTTAEELVLCDNFRLTEGVGRSFLRAVFLDELGVTDKSSLAEICHAASLRLHLVPCLPDRGPLFRLFNLAQERGTAYVVVTDLKMPADDNDICEIGLFVVFCDEDGVLILDAVTTTSSTPMNQIFSRGNLIFLFQDGIS